MIEYDMSTFVCFIFLWEIFVTLKSYIDTIITAPDTVQLTTEGDLSYFDQMLDEVNI